MLKKIIIVSGLFTLAVTFEASAFDLEDYATTYRASSESYAAALILVQQTEAKYKTAFNNRMNMELALRNLQKQTAIDAADVVLQKVAEDEIKKLSSLNARYNACGM